MAEEGEGLSPPAKKKKKGLPELVLTKESPSSSVNVSRAKFREQYMELHQLGEGGFGSVFAGYRVEDSLPVAIKHIPKNKVILKQKDENGRQLAMEVAIMLKLSAELIIVMERPMPSDNLFDYISDHKGPIQESKAKDANVFHSDIKPENILIETSSAIPRVFLIDFGLSCFDKRRKFGIFRGTTDHIPPEFDRHGSYSAGPTTVWQLGVVLFEILHKKVFKTPSFLTNKIKIDNRLPEKCKDFLNKRLTEVPEERPTLEGLLCHPWFS
ncbi:serine/threonine-protein kinase pim-1-like [Fundulus diaphanus]